MTPDEITTQLKNHFDEGWNEKQKAWGRCTCPDWDKEPHPDIPYRNICVACSKPINKGEERMDTGEGKFEMFEGKEQLAELREKYPKSKGVFTIGEEIEIRGSLFKIKDISPFGIKLKLLR